MNNNFLTNKEGSFNNQAGGFKITNDIASSSLLLLERMRFSAHYVYLYIHYLLLTLSTYLCIIIIDELKTSPEMHK